MVRNSPVSKPKAGDRKWKAKQTLATQDQIDKIMEESKLIAAQATQRAIEAIQSQNTILDPQAQLPSNITAMFENTPAKGIKESTESTGLTGAIKRLSFTDYATIT